MHLVGAIVLALIIFNILINIRSVLRGVFGCFTAIVLYGGGIWAAWYFLEMLRPLGDYGFMALLFSVWAGFMWYASRVARRPRLELKQ